MRYMQAWELYKQGKSYQEIAQIMGVSVSTVRRYIRRARRELGEETVQVPRSTGGEIEQVRVELNRLKDTIEEFNLRFSELDNRIEIIANILRSKIADLEEKIRELEERVENATISKISGVKVKDLASKVRAHRNIKQFVEGLIHKIAELDVAMGHYMSGSPSMSYDRNGTAHAVYSIYVGGLYIAYKFDRRRKRVEDVYLASMVYPTSPIYEDTYLRNLPKYAEKIVKWVSERLSKKIEEAVMDLSEKQAEKVQQIYQEIVEYINRNLGK